VDRWKEMSAFDTGRLRNQGRCSRVRRQMVSAESECRGGAARRWDDVLPRGAAVQWYPGNAMPAGNACRVVGP
jgi:hypothetical protein